MKIRNLDEVIENLRPFFKEYLEAFDTEFTTSHFTCPNRAEHENEDDKPSAAFFPNTEAFKCFSCEASGDIFTAAHFLEGKPISGPGFITDNVLYLAEMFGVKYEAEDYSPDELKREALFKILDDTCKLAHKALKSDNEAVTEVNKYIKDRGWEDLIDEFNFGYCPYDKLIKILIKKGYSEDTLREVGLMKPADTTKGNYEKYLLDDRLVFPIKNYYGRTVGFASRILRPPKDKEEKKYLNSRTTVLYNKTNSLFNLDKARLSQKIYIVEGYADVFTLYKQGIKNVIALCGLSFNETRYKLLVKNGISEAVFCLDNDSAGKSALKRIIDKDLKNMSGVDIYIKEIPNNDKYKDVDEYINSEGIEKFKDLEELSIFEWKLEQFRDNIDDVILKNDLIQLLVNEEDFTNKENMMKNLSEVMDISLESIEKEVNRHSDLGTGKDLTTSEDILEEVNCFERILNDWDRNMWSRTGALLGLDCKKFPIMTKSIDGLQNMFYIFAGDTNVGKSAFLLNLAVDLLASNEDIFVLFLSVDDTVSQLLPRMLAIDTDIPINVLANPKFKIKYNDELTEPIKEHMLLERSRAMTKLRGLADRFALKEESDAKNLEDIEKYIEIYTKIAGSRQLVVFVDNLHRITAKKKFDTRQLYMQISDSLKLWKTVYKVPVITTAELRKTYQQKRPNKDDIKETKDLIYDADLVGLLFSDFYDDEGTNLKFAMEDSEGIEAFNPVVEINIAKNKTSSFKSKLYYKFIPEYSKYIECTREEMGDYIKGEQENE